MAKNLFAKAKNKKATPKAKKDDKIIVNVEGAEFAEKLEKFATLKAQMDELKAEMAMSQEFVKAVGVEEFANLVDSNKNNVGSFILASENGGRVMVLPTKKYIKIDEAAAETLTETYGEDVVEKPLRSNDIPHPARTLLIVDSGYSIISWWHATDVPPETLDRKKIEDTAYVPGLEINKEKDLWPGQIEDAVDGRHPNKTVNVGFADGTVTRKKADDLFVEKSGDTYINRSPLWLPK